MPKQKTLAELNAEKEKIEQQLTQEQHKKQRLKNRIAYYERGDRTKRAHNLIVRSADIDENLSFTIVHLPGMNLIRLVAGDTCHRFDVYNGKSIPFSNPRG